MPVSRRMLPDLDALRAFETAARYGSFTQAAVELDLTQSAVSRKIKELEGRLGLTLFDRVRQRVVLSDSGRRLLPEARRLLAQAEEMSLNIIGTRNRATALKVATLPTFGGRWLMPRLGGYLAAHPDQHLSVHARTVPFDFDDEPFDLAIHYGQPVWPKAHCTFLCREEVIPALAPRLAASPDGTRRIATAAEIAALPLLHLESRPHLWPDWFAQGGEDLGLDAFTGHRFDQYAILIEAVLAGIGVGLVPRYLIERELATGAIVQPLDRVLSTEQAYYIVQPEGTAPSEASRTFQEWLLANVSGASRRRAVEPGARP